MSLAARRGNVGNARCEQVLQVLMSKNPASLSNGSVEMPPATRNPAKPQHTARLLVTPKLMELPTKLKTDDESEHTDSDSSCGSEIVQNIRLTARGGQSQNASETHPLLLFEAGSHSNATQGNSSTVSFSWEALLLLEEKKARAATAAENAKTCLTKCLTFPCSCWRYCIWGHESTLADRHDRFQRMLQTAKKIRSGTRTIDKGLIKPRSTMHKAIALLPTVGDLPNGVLQEIAENLGGLTLDNDYTLFLEVLGDELDCVKRLIAARTTLFGLFLALLVAFGNAAWRAVYNWVVSAWM